MVCRFSLSSCDTWGSRVHGLCSLQHVGSLVEVGELNCCSAWAYLPCGMWDLSSPTGDQTCVHCIGRWILYHWTTREVPKLFLLDSVLAGCMFLEICPFPLEYPNFWHIIVHSVLLWFFVSLWYQLWFFSLISDFIWVLSLFFLVSIAKGLFYFFSFQKSTSWFHWFFYCFLVSILFISSLMFIICFLLLTVVSVCSSFSSS